MAEFAAWLVEQRNEGRTLMDVGAKLQIQTSQLSRFASGVRIPSIEQAQKIEVLTDGRVKSGQWVVVAVFQERQLLAG